MFAILMAEKMSGTSVKIIKNEVGCGSDTMPKTVETRRHFEEDLEHAIIFRNPLPTSWFLGVQEIVACFKLNIYPPRSVFSFGTVSSLHHYIQV